MRYKYLSDSEILRWNKRLDSSGYSVYPMPNNKSAEPYICFKQKVGYQNNAMGEQFVVTTDPFIRYDFTFSVSSNKTNTFFEIFNKLSKINLLILRPYSNNNFNLLKLFLPVKKSLNNFGQLQLYKHI